MVRDYRPSDESVITQLLLQNLRFHIAIDPFEIREERDGYIEKTLRKIFTNLEEKSGRLVVAEYKGKVIGLCFGYVQQDSASYYYSKKNTKIGYISRLIVSEDYRGRGVGARLLDNIEKYLEEISCEYITLDVFASNTASHEIYKKRGYHDYKIEMIRKVI